MVKNHRNIDKEHRVNRIFFHHQPDSMGFSEKTWLFFFYACFDDQDVQKLIISEPHRAIEPPRGLCHEGSNTCPGQELEIGILERRSDHQTHPTTMGPWVYHSLSPSITQSLPLETYRHFCHVEGIAWVYSIFSTHSHILDGSPHPGPTESSR